MICKREGRWVLVDGDKVCRLAHAHEIPIEERPIINAPVLDTKAAQEIRVILTELRDEICHLARLKDDSPSFTLPTFPEINIPQYESNFNSVEQQLGVVKAEILTQIHELSERVKNLPPVTIVTEDKTVQVTTHSIDTSDILQYLKKITDETKELGINLNRLEKEVTAIQEQLNAPSPSLWKRLKISLGF